AYAENFLHFRLIRRCGRDSRKLEHAMARIKRYGDLVEAALLSNHIEQGWSCRSVSVVGNEQRIGGTGIFAGRKYDLTAHMRIGAFGGLAVQTHNLLSGGVRESSQDARFGHSSVALVFQDAAHRNAFVTESSEQQLPRLVVAHDPNRQHVDSEVGKIVDGIRAAAR